MKTNLQQRLVGIYMAWLNLTAWRQFVRQAEHPAQTQHKVLQEVLRRHRGTVFGAQHGFADIRDADQYRARVPVHDYEQLRGAIERQEQTGENILTADRPVHYLLTSGTTGKPKYIPLTKAALRHLQRCQKLTSYAHYRQVPEAFGGRMLGIAGSAVEGHMPGGAPFGCMSGVLRSAMTRFMKSRCIPVAPIEGADRYARIAREAHATRDITVSVTANPSTLVRLKELMVSQGLLDKDTLLGDHWPDLRAIITWTHGNCANYLPALRREFPQARLLEMGYLASEFFGTIPVSSECPVPTLGHYFFEFASVEEWDQGSRDTKLLHELETGRRYHIIVTSESGLYRYFINDIVEVSAWFRATPCLRFVQKGKGVTNLTGEKLYESQLLLAMKTVFGETPPNFFLMLAHKDPAQYRFYVEGNTSPALAETLDQALAELNVEYQAKRESGRLQKLRIVALKPGVMEAYRQHSLTHGQREAQFKLVHLAYAEQCDFDFSSFLKESA